MTLIITKDTAAEICRIISTVFSTDYTVRKHVDCTVSSTKHGLKITGMHCFSDRNNVLVIPYESEFSCSDRIAGKIAGKVALTKDDVMSGLIFRWSDICLTASPWLFEISLEDTIPNKFLSDCA